MPAPRIILELIERFERNLEAYKSGAYNETQVRHEFIDPFFEALGWDVNNVAGNAEAYKDVIHEDAVKVGGITKAPDYSFRIGGQRKFFVEAKKPSVNIKDAPAAAFQVRRYAWSAKLPLSIVTDFDELAVYDCRIKPDQNDKSDKARIKYYTYRQYPEKWDEIAAIFSKDAILKGSFDKYAESNKAKRGTAEVDSAFLAEIESWREMLAKNIALRNTLTVRELNDSVQRIIDRIIFLRIAEDRGIEDYGALRGIGNGNNTYGRLQELFYKADDRYNSGLFHFRHEKNEAEPPDNLTTALTIDDKPLKDILKTLYYPDSPYEFAVLPADILGQVYEQFLGKVIRLTSDHRAVVEDKPEVKKAGGVFYTPTYIVEYIVKNTVGKLLDGKTSKKAESLRILDPACGSGSFLLGAYQYLLDWHLKWYMENDPDKHAKTKKPALYNGQGGAWSLTTAERKRILLNNIYGVDIDSQAVEVTKLSLLLKVLEGETGETLNQQRRLFHERALPNLGGNIKCGNSLIGPDFYDGKQMNLLDDEETHRVNVFDWQAEFPEIFKAGGFDAVIGNPPWGASFSGAELEYLRRHYSRVIARMIDSYIYFLDRAIQVTREGGPLGFIIPSTILNQVDTKPVRQLLVTRGISQLVSLGQGIFGSKVLNTSTIIVSSQVGKQTELVLSNLSTSPLQDKADALLKLKPSTPWHTWRESLSSDPHITFAVGDIGSVSLLSRLRRKHGTLAEVLRNGIQRGVSPDVAAANVISNPDAKNANLEKELLRPSVSGPQIKRYREWETDQFIIYTTRDTRIQQYPRIMTHLEKFQHLNSCKEVAAGKHPYWALHRPRNSDIFLSPKFIGLTTSKTIEIIYDPDRSVFVTDAMYVFVARPEIDPWALMAILQSRPFLFLYRVANQGESRVIPQVKAAKLEPLPFPKWQPQSAGVSELSSRCKTMYQLHKQLPEAKTGHEQTLIQRQIDATDRQIDKLVYELYGLTDEEIAIVEA
jgi:predicted type IV restriction endonuclease